MAHLRLASKRQIYKTCVIEALGADPTDPKLNAPSRSEPIYWSQLAQLSSLQVSLQVCVARICCKHPRFPTQLFLT